MNSFRPIAIHSADDSSRSSLDMGNQSWKLEKMVDGKGKSNYKLVTSGSSSRAVVNGRGNIGGAASTREKRNRNKRASQQNAAVLKSIGAYGVPGANAYLNTKAPTLNSSVMRTNIKKVKNIEAIKTIQDLSDASSKSLRNDTERVLEGYAESYGKLSRNMMIGNNGKFVPYIMDGNDFLQKSFAHGHLVSSNIHLYNMHLLLSYFGTTPIAYCTVSLWSQIFSPALELVNLMTIPIQDIVSTKGRFLTKEIVMDTVPPGQIFVTVNFPEEFDGFLSIKYSIEGTQIYENQRERDVPFEFPDFFLNQGIEHLNNNNNPLRAFAALNKKQFSLPETVVSAPEQPEPEPEPEPAPAPPVTTIIPQPVYASVNTLPKLPKNLFGDYIRGKTEGNIPIFGNPINDKSVINEDEKNTSTTNNDKNESSIFLNHSTHAAKKMNGRVVGIETHGEEDTEFTEKDDTDIHKILSFLRAGNPSAQA
jgi:hypothetical protein